MNLNKIALVSGLVVGGIAVSSVVANAATVTTVEVNGKSYDITTITGTFNDNSTLLESQPWWSPLNTGTPASFANAVAFSLGTPNSYNSNPAGPYFGYDIVGENINSEIYSGTSAHRTNVPSDNTATYAIVTAVPEPLNILGATTGLALFGIASTALKKRKVSK